MPDKPSFPHTPAGQLTATMTNLANFQGQFNLDKSGYNPNMPGTAPTMT